MIDGQQRITTISLLLIAAIHAVKNHEMKIEDESKINYAFEVFLKANFCSGARKQKLVPIENDMDAYFIVRTNTQITYLRICRNTFVITILIIIICGTTLNISLNTV